MKAVVVNRAGPYREVFDFREDFLMTPLKSGEARVKVYAAGLAFPDILTAEGKHVHPLGKTPRVLGREVCGQVVATTESSPLKIGDWVFGPGKYGGWSEYAVVENAVSTFTPSPTLSPIVLAGFGLNYGTSYHALVHNGELKRGETLLILGASAIGLAAIDIAKNVIGARVVACTSSPEKMRACMDAGADHVVDYTDPKKMREKIEAIFRTPVERDEHGKKKTTTKSSTGQAGGHDNDGFVDVVFDAVGGAWSEPALRTLKFGGRFLVLGFASGTTSPKSAIPSIPLNLALLNERKIVGVLYGTWKARNLEKDRVMIETMVELISRGVLKPLVIAYPARKFLEGMDDLMTRKSIGKIVFDFSGV